MTAGKDPRKCIAIAIAGAIGTEAPSGRLRAIAPFVLREMTDQELYDLYVEHIWTKVLDCYQDEIDQCEKVILAGVRAITELAYERAARVAEESGAYEAAYIAADIRKLKDS